MSAPVFPSRSLSLTPHGRRSSRCSLGRGLASPASAAEAGHGGGGEERRERGGRKERRRKEGGRKEEVLRRDDGDPFVLNKRGFPCQISALKLEIQVKFKSNVTMSQTAQEIRPCSQTKDVTTVVESQWQESFKDEEVGVVFGGSKKCDEKGEQKVGWIVGGRGSGSRVAVHPGGRKAAVRHT